MTRIRNTRARHTTCMTQQQHTSHRTHFYPRCRVVCGFDGQREDGRTDTQEQTDRQTVTTVAVVAMRSVAMPPH